MRRSVQRGASELVEDGKPKKQPGEAKVSLLLNCFKAVTSFMSALLKFFVKTFVSKLCWAFKLGMHICMKNLSECMSR